MRLTALALLSALALAPFAAAQSGGFIEENTYRSGGTYAVIAGVSAQACSDSCGQDARCLSWSFVRHGSQRPVSRCELKAGIGAAEPDPNALSGISPRHEASYPAARLPAPEAVQTQLLGAAPPAASRVVVTVPAPSARPAPAAPVAPSATPQNYRQRQELDRVPNYSVQAPGDVPLPGDE